MKRLKKILIYFLAFVFIIVVYSTYKVYVYAKQYSNQKSDVAIVLGAGAHNGIVSNVFRERLNHSITLLNNNKVDYILITGGFGAGQEYSDSKMARTYLESKGVQSDKILIEEKSTITFFNIYNSKLIMNDLQLNTALIVSDHYHMKRAMKMCQKIGINSQPSPTPTSMYRSKSTKRKFLFKQGYNYAIYLLLEQFRPIPKN